jgi:hypothetical protein
VTGVLRVGRCGSGHGGRVRPTAPAELEGEVGSEGEVVFLHLRPCVRLVFVSLCPSDHRVLPFPSQRDPPIRNLVSRSSITGAAIGKSFQLRGTTPQKLNTCLYPRGASRFRLLTARWTATMVSTTRVSTSTPSQESWWNPPRVRHRFSCVCPRFAVQVDEVASTDRDGFSVLLPAQALFLGRGVARAGCVRDSDFVVDAEFGAGEHLGPGKLVGEIYQRPT